MAKLKLTYPQFRHAPVAICGAGSVRELAGLDDGATVFLTSRQSAVNEVVGSVLAQEGGELTPANNCRKSEGEPSAESIRDAADFLGSRRFRRVVAVGGGSVLDWARLGWLQSAGALDRETGAMRREPPSSERPEFWLVPTTCGTGAEAADVAVFRSGSGSKAAVVTPAFLADRVVLDGRFLETISASKLPTLVADALTHALEGSLSIVPLPLGKEAAFAALHLILASYTQSPNGSQRDRLMEAGFLGGIAAANCSVGIVHAFAHSIGVDGLPHGLANACALEAGLRFNAETSQMQTLLQRTGLRTVDDLIHKVRTVLDDAIAAMDEHPSIVASVRETGYREQLAAKMAHESALRSNPRRPTAEELTAFVDAVAERVGAT